MSKIFISFVEECICNPKYHDYVAGRIEVYRKGPYADEEIRFFTKDREKFYAFREEYDMSKVTEEKLEAIKRVVQLYFMEV